MGIFSLVGLKLKHSRWILRSHGLQPRVIELQNGCKIHCWAPAAVQSAPSSTSSASSRSLISGDASQNSENVTSFDLPSKPAVLLLHGFGGNGTIAWNSQVAALSRHFSLYLPDLLFFGDSIADGNLTLPHTARDPHLEKSSTSKEEHSEEVVRYSEFFQAECMHQAMSMMGVQEAVVIGHSYGGFVAYGMAHLYPSFVKRVVIVSSGIMMNSHTNDSLLSEFGCTRIHDILVPPTLTLFKKSLQFSFNGFFPPWLPSFFYNDMYESLSGCKERRLQLVDDIIIGTEDSPPLPTIEQNTLILWGEKDRIFDIALAYQLKEFLGPTAELCTIASASHVPHFLNSKEINKLILSFLKISQ